jgi:hypothetical protein
MLHAGKAIGGRQVSDDNKHSGAVVSCWRKPERLVAGAAGPDEVARGMVESLTRSLRRGGGVRRLADFGRVASQVACAQITPLEAMSQLQAIEQLAGGDRHTRVVAQAVARLIVEPEHSAALVIDPEGVVCESFCWELLDHCLLGQARAKVVGKRFTDHAGMLSFERECREKISAALRKVAADLAADPTAARLKAPRGSVSVRRSTAEILKMALTV